MDEYWNALCRRLNDVADDSSLSIPVQLQVVGDDSMVQKLSAVSTSTRNNNYSLIIRKDDIHNTVLMRPNSAGLAALRRLSILHGSLATLRHDHQEHIQPNYVTVVLCMDKTPEKEQNEEGLMQEDEEAEDDPNEDIYREEHSYQVEQPVIILISSTLAATLGCAWSGDAIIHFVLQEYISDYPAALPRNESLVYASEAESVPMAHIVTVSCLGCPVHLTTAKALVCPRPTEGILVTEKCLMRVLDPVSSHFFYYEVAHVQEGKHNHRMDPRGTYRTTTETVYQFLDTFTAPDGACCRRLPPLPILPCEPDEEATNTVNAEHSYYPNPNLPALAQSLQGIAATSSPEERIFPLVGTEHEHDVCRLVQAAAHLVGMRYLPVVGLAAFAALNGHPVTTGSIADQLEGLQIALNQAKKGAPCVLHLVDLDTEFSSHRQDPSLLEEHEYRLWSLLVDALDPTRYQTTNKAGGNNINQTPRTYATYKFEETDQRWAPSLIVVISTTRRLASVSATGPLSQNLVYDALSLTQPDTEFAKFLWEECDRLYDCTGNKLGAKDIEDDLAERPVHDIRILHELWRRFLTSASTVVTKEQETKEFRKICHNLDRKRRKQGSKSSSSVATIANVKWEDVGGLAQVRKEIMDTIELPLQYPRFFPYGGRSGILLYGM
jgi:hypothetical protein